jgi:phosphate transport system substrate-binding protein
VSLPRLACVLSVALVVGAVGTTGSAIADTLTGAGSTLVAPLEHDWAAGFGMATGNTVQYDAVGSGAGVADISAGNGDFGASDAPLTSAQSAHCDSGHCVTIPWALSATGIGYNVPGVGHGLKLTGTVLAKIYLGNITNWDNNEIKALNPGLKLPDLKIAPVERTDASGDTYAFTNYLSDVDSSWARKIGYSTAVSWPTGVTAYGNAGVAGELATIKGSIGYVAASYLVDQKIDVAAIQNADGNYTVPNITNIENAAAVVHTIPPNGLHIVDPPKTQTIAYPISTFTYVIVPATPSHATLLKSFLTYCLTTGHSQGVTSDFAPIPTVVQTAAESLVDSLR